METVKLIECPRDAWQGLPRQIPVARKAEYLRALIAAGCRQIDAVSFVSPKAVPQMADSEQVLAELGDVTAPEIIGIVVNERGAQRAIATGKVRTLGFPFSISETFLRRNQNQSPGENLDALQRVHELAREAGLGTVAYISMAFGNPYGDEWNEQKVADAAGMIASFGIGCVSVADTIGAADAELIARVVEAVLRIRANAEIGVHLHSTRDGAGERVLAAFDAGCRRFDSAFGGLGGCPFAQNDLVGNLPTEEVVRALRQRGVTVPLGKHLDQLTALSDAIRDEFATIG